MVKAKTKVKREGVDSLVEVRKKKVTYYKQMFHDKWLSDPELSSWLRKHPGDDRISICNVCKCTFKYANRSQLIKHKDTSKHLNAMAKAAARGSDIEVKYFKATFI